MPCAVTYTSKIQNYSLHVFQDSMYQYVPTYTPHLLKRRTFFPKTRPCRACLPEHLLLRGWYTMVHEGLLWIFHGGPNIALHCYILCIATSHWMVTAALHLASLNRKKRTKRSPSAEFVSRRQNTANQHHVLHIVEIHERLMRLT